ncbi:MAG TPA: secretin N-terminal domain-containing protein [Thermoanaerobaculia bacterium]
MTPLARTVPLLLSVVIALSGAPAAGQAAKGQDENLQVYAYTLRHKPAAEALVLIRPLLSRRGTVELQPRGNTLVVRDTLAALGRVVPTLRAYDRPPEALRVHVMIVRADTRPVAVTPKSKRLPDPLEKRLRELLRWDYYQVLAEAALNTREGQNLAHEVNSLYGVSFRMGTLFQDERLKLHDFKLWRSGAEDGKYLLEATLHLWLRKPKVVGLANSESSDHALMVILTCDRVPEPEDSPPRRPKGGR